MAHNLRSLLIAINNRRLLLVRRSGCGGTPAERSDVSMGRDGCMGRLRSCHGAIIVRCAQLFADCQTVAVIVPQSLKFFHEPPSPPDFNFCPPDSTPLDPVPVLVSPQMPPPAVMAGSCHSRADGILHPRPASVKSLPLLAASLFCFASHLPYPNFWLSLFWISVRFGYLRVK